jgi:hypothetical protein
MEISPKGPFPDIMTFWSGLNPHFDAINYNKIEYLLKKNKIFEAEAFCTDNNSFFSEGLKSKIRTRLLKAKAKKVSLEKKIGQKL